MAGPRRSRGGAQGGSQAALLMSCSGSTETRAPGRGPLVADGRGHIAQEAFFAVYLGISIASIAAARSSAAAPHRSTARSTISAPGPSAGRDRPPAGAPCPRGRPRRPSEASLLNAIGSLPPDQRAVVVLSPARVHAGRDRDDAEHPPGTVNSRLLARPRRDAGGGRAKPDLSRIECPGAAEAEERAARIIAAAFAETAPPRDHTRMHGLGCIAAVAAGRLSRRCRAQPTGSRVRPSRALRAVGVDHGHPALFTLLVPGTPPRHRWQRHLQSTYGDGSRRLLGTYYDATWLLFGRYVAATGANELASWSSSRHRSLDAGATWREVPALDGQRHQHPHRLPQRQPAPRRRGRRHWRLRGRRPTRGPAFHLRGARASGSSLPTPAASGAALPRTRCPLAIETEILPGREDEQLPGPLPDHSRDCGAAGGASRGPERPALRGDKRVHATVRAGVGKDEPEARGSTQVECRPRGWVAGLEVASAVARDDVEPVAAEVGDAGVGVAARPAREPDGRSGQRPADGALRVERGELVGPVATTKRPNGDHDAS